MKKQQNKKKLTQVILFFAFVLLFVFSVVMIIYNSRDYISSSSDLNNLQSVASTPKENVEKEEVIEDTSINFDELSSINPDVVAWIKIADTPLDNPVVQGADNSKYLSTSFYGKYNSLGTVFLDYRATYTQEAKSTNLTFYGHHAKNGTFFATLLKYKDQDFYDNHKYIELQTAFEKTTWEVIAGFEVDLLNQLDVDFDYHNFVQANSETEFNNFMSQINSRNRIQTDTTAIYGDNLLTLSTCSYISDDARFVLLAKQISSEVIE